MSITSIDLARANHDARLVEVEQTHRASRAAAARRLQRRAVRLSQKAERISRRADRAANRARLAVARVI
ncbi:MAG: hypothetical protein ABIR34_06125 [Marmoricola sp.]